MTLTYREYRPEELETVSALLDAVFPGGHVGPAEFALLREVNDDFTVAVAEDGGRLVGAIPMVRRPVQVAPGVALDAWVQFRVGVSEACRGQGVGQGMQQAIAQFLAGRGDLLMIISTSEAARPYRFYRANGFHDVSYPRRYLLPPAAGEPQAVSGVVALSASEFYAAAARWRQIFDACYAGYGGFVRRTERTLSPARGALAEALGQRLAYWVALEQGRAVGYAIVQQNRRGDALEELAVSDGRVDLAARLIAAARSACGSLAVSTTGDALLARACQGFNLPTPGRWKNANAVVVKPLDVPANYGKIDTPPPALAAAALRVWTPEREAVLYAPPGGAARDLTLELKEDMLARLLVRRMDLECALREERATLKGALPGDAAALAGALRPAPWVFQPIDGL